MTTKRFRAVVGGDEGERPLFELPFDAKEVFGSARAPVVATVNKVSWRTTVAVYGGKHYVGMRRELREKAGVEMGETVSVTLESDDAPRTVEVPSEFLAALRRSPAAKKAFDRLSFTHRREYVEWITGAKKEETRSRRLSKAVTMLEDGKKEP
ncbi:MAG: hypothetical protein QOH90_1902 [Actinomycetota bacterium]|nr:hypothetical protein [Actinomycetota bacterium]